MNRFKKKLETLNPKDNEAAVDSSMEATTLDGDLHELEGLVTTHESANDLLDMAKAIQDSGTEIHPMTVQALKTAHVNLARNIKLSGSVEYAKVTHEDATSEMEAVVVTHEGAMEIIEAAWDVLVETLKKIGHEAKKLYITLMSKIRRLDSKYDDLVTNFKELKDVTLEDVSLESDEWKTLKGKISTKLGIIGVPDFTAATVDGIIAIIEKEDDIVKKFTDKVIEDAKSLASGSSALVAKDIYEGIDDADLASPSLVKKFVNTDSDLVLNSNLVGKKIITRTDGKHVSAIYIKYKENRLTSKYVAETVAKEWVKVCRRTDDDVAPPVAKLVDLLKAVKKVQHKKSSEAIDKITKHVDKITKDMKDSDDKAPSEIARLRYVKGYIQVLSPAITRIARDKVVSDYNLKIDILKITTFLYKQYESNSKKKKDD